MDAELAAVVAAFVEGKAMNVAARCRELGISRETFYKYVARFRARGVEGFFPDSRRPLTSPTRLPAVLEDVLVRVRKEQAEAGWDYGATGVLLELQDRPGLWPADRAWPSRATINRVFEARGLLAKVPQRRPRRRSRRFNRAEVNALWQFDGFETLLADGTKAVVLHLSDDCSRVDLALQAASSENSTDIIATFRVAVARYGLPAQLLSDNGSAFSGRRRGFIGEFDRFLTDLGVQPITSRVSHPQTCGKNERAHQRVQKWLARRPHPHDLPALQELLEDYRDRYNDRPNAVLGGLRPHQRFDLGPLAGPGPDRPIRTHVTTHKVSTSGCIGLSGHLIGLGRRHQGHSATVFRSGDHVVVFVRDDYVGELLIDPDRHYQRVD